MSDPEQITLAWDLVSKCRKLGAIEEVAQSYREAKIVARHLRNALLVLAEALEEANVALLEIGESHDQILAALKAQMVDTVGERQSALDLLGAQAAEIEAADGEARVAKIVEAATPSNGHLPVPADAAVAPFSVYPHRTADEEYTGRVVFDVDTDTELHERTDGTWQRTMFPSEITGVHWQGSTAAYEANRDEIHREIAEEVTGKRRANPPDGVAETPDGIAQTPDSGADGIAQTD